MAAYKRIILFTFLMGSIFLVSGCYAGPEQSRKPSDDWGRGVLVGTDAIGSVAVAVDENSTDIHAIWPFGTQEGLSGVRYIQLGSDVTVNLERDVILSEGQIRGLHLLSTGANTFHLLWSTRINSASEWELWYAQMDTTGELLMEPLLVSDPEAGISDYSVVSDGDNGIIIVWENAHGDEIMLTGVSSQGERQVANRIVTKQGFNPDVAVDEHGQIHLCWQNDINYVYYAKVDDLVNSSFEPVRLTNILLGTGAALDGPFIGVADDFVYLMWSVLYQSGLEAGTAKTEYVTFPNGKPNELRNIAELAMLPIEVQPYQPVNERDGYSTWVPASYVNRTSPFIYKPSLVVNPESEMAVAVSMMQDYRLDAYIQIAVAILDDGEYKGYMVATRTESISSDPILVADNQRNLHLFWRDGFSKSKVFYTTTDPIKRAILDKPKLRDITTLVLSGGMESLAGVLLFPLAFPWMFPGLVLAVIWRMRRNDEDISERASQVVLAISLILYQLTKVFVFPTMVDYIPFSAWVDIPDLWRMPVRIIVPVLIFVAALAVSEKTRRGKKTPPSTLYYYFIVVIADTALTLAIYGVNFLGAY